MSLSVWLRHPLIFARKAWGRFRRRFTELPDDAVIEQIRGKVRFEHRVLPFLNADDMRAMLTHSYDILLCTLLSRRLEEGDIVLDAGANVGYISAQAAACVGTTGEIHGFEPLSECFERLQRLRELNPEFNFKFNNVALGDNEGSLSIAYDPRGSARDATLVPGNSVVESRRVHVMRLDDYIFSAISLPQRISLIKIDVEGFEFPVLLGLERFFAETTYRPWIVCEVKPWVLAKLGHSTQEFDLYMKRFGYVAYDMLDTHRPVQLKTLSDMGVLLFRAESPASLCEIG